MSKFNISVEEVDDWHNLQYKINKYFAHWDNYVFRGQGQDNWLLESTLTRALKNINAKSKDELVANHLDTFKREIRSRRGENPRSLTENELWAQGQHFGLYTPLLDWTESAWVAVFFSLISEKSETGKRALFALHIKDIERINSAYLKKFPNNKKNIVELLHPEIDENRRLVNQKGLFTKIDIENDIEKWVAKAPKIGNWITLYKIVFPDTLRQKVLLYLNLMNINYSSLFPDLHGSSKYTNSKLLLTDYLEERQQMDWNNSNVEDEDSY